MLPCPTYAFGVHDLYKCGVGAPTRTRRPPHDLLFSEYDTACLFLSSVADRSYPNYYVRSRTGPTWTPRPPATMPATPPPLSRCPVRPRAHPPLHRAPPSHPPTHLTPAAAVLPGPGS